MLRLPAHVLSHLGRWPSGPFHSELLEEPSSRVFPLVPAGKSDPVWEMDTLPVGKEWRHAGEQGDTQQPQASSQACLQGWEGKEGKLLGGTRKESPGKGAGVLR